MSKDKSNPDPPPARKPDILKESIDGISNIIFEPDPKPAKPEPPPPADKKSD